MNGEKNWLPSNHKTAPVPRWFTRHFGSLRVRYKLMVLHNLFFLVLSVAVYLSVIPVFSEHMTSARQRELHMAAQLFGAELPVGSSTAP